jgi:hypothetical protein
VHSATQAYLLCLVVISLPSLVVVLMSIL